MEISLAKPQDANAILVLQTQIYRVESLAPNAKELLLALIDADYCSVIVARENLPAGKAGGKVVGSAFLFYLPLPAHGKNFAYLEAVVVDEKSRGKGIGTAISKKAIELARANNCYKMIFTSGFDREKIHKLYENLGFAKWGYEFRMNLD
ncbi:MAG: GNAT family N-acetyltransferase [Candidatus Curtissbacteria bacterium]|nr:GNAT family N-acetyltransferase [Candidatus Curtissbacteria bacterium]